MDVAEQVLDEARKELERGKKTAAARLLTDAAYRTRDPRTAAEIVRIAEEARDRAGFLGKGRWNEIIRVATLRMSGGESAGRHAA